jgi:7-cyano-7-deazaguanine synthase
MSVVLFSGGMDSTACLAVEVAEGDPVIALSVDYGQRHAKEIAAAAEITAHYGVEHVVVDLSVLQQVLRSALTGDMDVPDGHYAEQSMRQTVVPNRNMIMLSVAAGVASSRDMNRVVTAVHAGDHYIYPDCRPEFISAVSTATRLGTATFGDVEVEAPFVHVTKTDIVRIGHDANAPLAMSWSCYKGGDIHCGACGTCYERREAFINAGVLDQTMYAETPTYNTPEGVS